VSRHDVLLDAGPLVAIVSRDDSYHERCVAELAHLRTPLLTTWPVVTEALWLLRHNANAVSGLFRGFADGVWALVPIPADALPWLEAFLKRYRKLGAQLADASLVYLAERKGIDRVFTLDRRDFAVYRYAKNRSLKLIPGPSQ
jgi:predicted nucleic acid-binding protein